VRRKVRFIEPAGRSGRPFNAWLAQWPLLGPITLATILHRRGFDAAVYNENVSGPLPENQDAFEDTCSADVVGITIMTATAARGYYLARQIKEHAPRARVVFGGPHATFMPLEALRYGDLVVRGEGENVIESIAAGEVDSGIVDGPPVADLDAIPAPEHELMRDFGRLLERFRKRELYELPVMTSRGCPYGCTFCSVSRMFGRKIRRQSVGKTVRDLRTYVQRGFRQFFFYDDNFTAAKRWIRSLMAELEPLGVRFSAQSRVDFPWIDRDRGLVDQPLLDAMRRAGGHVLYIGYETIEEPRALQWRKGYRGRGGLRARLHRDTQVLHDNGFWIHGMFVFGPDDTEQTAHRILEFARETKLETIQVSILTPLPGTPLFEEMRPHLLFTDFPNDWDFYDGTHCVYNHARLGIEALQRTIIQLHQRFYRGYVWSLRRVKDLVGQPGPLLAKLALMWSSGRALRETFERWQQEVENFLELAATRQRVPIVTGSGGGEWR